MAQKVNSTRTCQRCHQPVRSNADHIRAIHWASSSGALQWHWNCFVALLKEHSGVTARELCEAASGVEVAQEPGETWIMADEFPALDAQRRKSA